MRVTGQAHEAVRAVVRPGETVIDATTGNGHDTVFLAECVGPGGRVIGFDVQEVALAATRRCLAEAGIEAERVDLRCTSHANLAGEVAGPVAAVMFNLGYLPGGDHSRVTTPAATVPALEAAVGLLREGGILTVVCYPDHSSGKEEVEAVKKWAKTLAPRGFHPAWSSGHYGPSGPRLLRVNKLGKSIC